MHLLADDEWNAAKDAVLWEPASFQEVGFVHLSTPQQVHLPANGLYQGRTDLVALLVDAGKVDAEIRWEPGAPDDPEQILFPHLYGPLPVRAVIGSVRYKPDADGRFSEFTGYS